MREIKFSAWDWGGGTTNDLGQFREVIGNIYENEGLTL